jgi:ATP-dependent helicase/nuclease subunit A
MAVMATQALTAEQEEAVARRRGPLLLAAGAGSGKTSVLVERFVRAVREDGIAPGRIAAITFTERAAAELRGRVRARLLELGEREAARDTEGAPIGTFHGFCARLLRIHALTAGLDPDFAILDEAGAGRLALLAFRHALAALLTGSSREEAVDLLAAYGHDRVRGMVVGVYAEQRSRGTSLPSLPHLESSEPAEREAIRACELLGTILEEFGHRYAELKRARSALDFDDLELCARELLERHEGVRRMWSERLELLMVDEFQDTNRRQLALLRLLERDNLFTVGDALQSIYGFRHAEVEIFHERRRELESEGAALALVHNFRSRPPLLAAVNAVFGERFGEAFAPLLAARESGHAEEPLAETGMLAETGTLAETGMRAKGECLPASVESACHPASVKRVSPESVVGECPPASVELLLTDRGTWSDRTLAERQLARDVAGTLPPATLWRHAEARLLAQRVAELVAGGQVAAGDVAVLLRAASDLPVYERALEERGLRTLAAVGSFWSHQQVGDLLMWLRVLASPLDELALYSVLASPLVGLSSDGLALLALHARAVGAGVWAAIVGVEGTGKESVNVGGVESGVEGMGREGVGVESGVEGMGREGMSVGGGGVESGVEDTSLDQGEGTGASAESELHARLCAPDRERLARFAERFAAERRDAPTHPLAELLLRALAHTGYEQHVLSLPAGERRLANIHKLLRLARRFEAAEGRDLRGFLDHVEHTRAFAEGSEAHAPTDAAPDAVRLMTIHAAKGLEFPVVCLADLGRATAGTPPDLLVDGERIGLRLARLDGSPPASCLRYEELSEERRRAEAAEEERIVYVAMTRARERLLLSGSCDFARWPGAGGSPVAAGGAAQGVARAQAGGAPIVWLAPALAPELPALARTLERPVVELAVGGGATEEDGPGGDGVEGRARVLCWLNTPSTVGAVLREQSLAPRARGAPSAP